MMTMLRRQRQEQPGDPLGVVNYRRVQSVRALAEADSPWPAIWMGNGCDLAGVRAGTSVDPDVIERLVAEYEGVDVCLTEPLDMVRFLAIHNVKRGPEWFDGMTRYVRTMLPATLGTAWSEFGVGLDVEHTKFVAAVFTHRVTECWTVNSTIFHAHAIVPGQVWCDDRR